MPTEHQHLRYMVYQLEECPTTGRIHYQGYAEFTLSLAMSTVKSALGDPAVHLEGRRGSQADAIAYCTKEDTRLPGTEPFEYGTPAKDRTRTDLTSFRTDILNGRSDLELSETHTNAFARYPRFVDRLRFAKQQSENRLREVKVYILWGDTGCGKTRYVYDHHNIDDIFKLDLGDSTTVWYDGYVGQSVLLIDDFYGQIKYHVMLNLLDIYPYRLAIKGGHTMANWNTVYITSNKEPGDWWKSAMGGFGVISPAFQRRLTGIYHCTGIAGDATWVAEHGTLLEGMERSDNGSPIL